MPMRYIVIPEPVHLKDPKNGAPVGSEPWTFLTIVEKLLSNPMWLDSYAAMRASAAISGAVASASSEGSPAKYVALAEEDWVLLKSAVDRPRTMLPINGQLQVVAGYGAHAIMTPQILPLLEAIVDAKTTPPSS